MHLVPHEAARKAGSINLTAGEPVQPNWRDKPMQVTYERCAGIDVHKKTVVVCCLSVALNGKAKRETRTYGTTTRELLSLCDWLSSQDMTHVAMESTGEYWKPVYNLLESSYEVMVVTDISGVSARAMLKALVNGTENPEALAAHAKGRLRNKQSALTAALTGRVREHHRFLIQTHLQQLEFLEAHLK